MNNSKYDNSSIVVVVVVVKKRNALFSGVGIDLNVAVILFKCSHIISRPFDFEYDVYKSEKSNEKVKNTGAGDGYVRLQERVVEKRDYSRLGSNVYSVQRSV